MAAQQRRRRSGEAPAALNDEFPGAQPLASGRKSALSRANSRSRAYRLDTPDARRENRRPAFLGVPCPCAGPLSETDLER